MKYMADKEPDIIKQCMLYLEAALYFLLYGNALEHSGDRDKPTYSKMYKETLSLIK